MKAAAVATIGDCKGETCVLSELNHHQSDYWGQTLRIGLKALV